MSELSIDIKWGRKEADLLPGKYSSEHEVIYNQTYKVQSDTAPDWGGSEDNTNPEQALAASLSSCHMMTFLALAAKIKWPVCDYKDHAVAYIGKNKKGQMSVNRIDLNPTVSFDEGFEINEEKLVKMQERAHRYCFIANSLDENVEVNIN
jgi:organic hydroperoxide reductase OsmC/OhrA